MLLKNYLKLSILLAYVIFISVSCQESEPEPCCGPQYVPYFPPESGTWSATDPSDLDWNLDSINSLYAMLEDNGTRAFIVLHQGHIVLENYWGKTILGNADFEQDSKWYWASAAKTLTGFTVQKVAQEQQLNLDERTSNYLGEGWTSLTKTQEDKITIWHQLTMTSGMDDAQGDATEAENLTYMADAGTRWSYHNAPYTLLEKVVTNATGRDFESYFNEKLQSEIGMTGNWQWSGDNHLYLSDARSAARFGLLMQNYGQWDGKELLEWQRAESAISTSQEINKSYGYLWWLNGKGSFMLPQSQITFAGDLLPNAPKDTYSAMGKNGQYISISPRNELVIVRMGDSPSQALVPLLFLDDIWEKMNGVMN